jgi:tight adherence protein B
VTPSEPLVTVVLAALLVALLLPGPGASLPRASRAGAHGGRAAGSPWFVGVVVGALLAGASVLLDGVRLAVALVVLGATAGVLHLRARERRRQEAGRTRAAVVEVGEALVGELRAGRDVETALRRAATSWQPFGSVARSAVLGADVPAALRRLAREPGAEGLRDLAAAWDVAERTGGRLGDVLTQVVEGGRGVHEDLRTVSTELASARATARLMVLLPVVTLALAAGTGSAPWRLLVSEPLGVACLAAGTALSLAGLLWIDRIADGVVGR